MNIHKNSKLTARDREEMIRRMQAAPAAAVATGFGVSLRTAEKWMSRFRQGGSEALADRSSRPGHCRSKLTEHGLGRVFALRKKRLTGDEIALRLAWYFGPCVSSVVHSLPVWKKDSLYDAIDFSDERRVNNVSTLCT